MAPPWSRYRPGPGPGQAPWSQLVLGLSETMRYELFVAIVAEHGVAWGLMNPVKDWAMLQPDGEVAGFLLWPARESAWMAGREHWSDYSPTAIPLDQLTGPLSESLTIDGLNFAVFPDASRHATMVPPLELVARIRATARGDAV